MSNAIRNLTVDELDNVAGGSGGAGAAGAGACGAGSGALTTLLASSIVSYEIRIQQLLDFSSGGCFGGQGSYAWMCA